MRGSLSRLLLLIPAALVLACTDASRESPTVLAPDPALTLAVPPGCDIDALESAARAYLSDSDIILRRLSGLEELLTIGSPAAFNAGLNVLARIAEARHAGIAGDAATGALVAHGTLVCIGATPLPSLAELTSALGTDPTGGVFEVLGGARDPQRPAVAVSASPLWGAEPQPGQSWPSSSGNQRFLLYAFRLVFDTFTDEEPALLTPGSPTEEGTAFEMQTIPQNVLTHLPLIGVCVDNPDRYRVQWVQNILSLHELAFCGDAASTSVAAARPGGLLGAASRALGWLAPKPLYAAALIGGGTGGLPSGFSPFGAVDVEASVVGLAIDPVAHGNRTTPIDVTVRATSEHGNAVDDVLVVLRLSRLDQSGNEGPYQLVGVGGRTTAGGVITLSLAITQPGAYKVRAIGYFNGNEFLPTLTATSNRFEITAR